MWFHTARLQLLPVEKPSRQSSSVLPPPKQLHQPLCARLSVHPSTRRSLGGLARCIGRRRYPSFNGSKRPIKSCGANQVALPDLPPLQAIAATATQKLASTTSQDRTGRGRKARECLRRGATRWRARCKSAGRQTRSAGSAHGWVKWTARGGQRGPSKGALQAGLPELAAAQARTRRVQQSMVLVGGNGSLDQRRQRQAGAHRYDCRLQSSPNFVDNEVDRHLREGLCFLHSHSRRLSLPLLFNRNKVQTLSQRKRCCV